ERLMSQHSPAQVEFTINGAAKSMFQMLRHDLTEDHLLGEILRADRDRVFLRTADDSCRPQSNDQTGDNLCSTHSSPRSAANAIKAAGTAPARSSVVSTDARPRKINTPSPPPPMAAAIVAVPIVVTVAIRRPAKIVLAASGSSTSQRSCRPVIPIAIADSRTPDSTFRMPVRVFRRIGRSAYNTSATIAVCLPIPPRKGRGIRNPKSARL